MTTLDFFEYLVLRAIVVFKLVLVLTPRWLVLASERLVEAAAILSADIVGCFHGEI